MRLTLLILQPIYMQRGCARVHTGGPQLSGREFSMIKQLPHINSPRTQAGRTRVCAISCSTNCSNFSGISNRLALRLKGVWTGLLSLHIRAQGKKNKDTDVLKALIRTHRKTFQLGRPVRFQMEMGHIEVQMWLQV